MSMKEEFHLTSCKIHPRYIDKVFECDACGEKFCLSCVMEHVRTCHARHESILTKDMIGFH